MNHNVVFVVSLLIAMSGIASSKLCAQSYDILIPPSTVQGRTVWCVDGAGIPVTTGCLIWVTPHFYADTNGHFHNTNRPRSQVAASSGGPFSSGGTFVTTGGQGNAIVWIATSNVGQAEYLTACADFCSSGDHGVGYSGIHWVEEKPEWIHTGGHTTGHGGNEFNHWMTSSAAWGIWYTAVEYLDRYPTQGQIAVNDMSLPFGGIFDLNQNWQGPHDAHSWGTAVDVRGNGGFLSIPVGPQLDEFVQICEDEGAIEAGIHSPGTSNQHIHCRWPH